VKLKNNIIFKSAIAKNLKQNTFLKKEIESIYKDINLKKNSLNSLGNRFKLNFDKNELSKFYKFKNIAVIGMGGSILGTKAIYNFLRTKIKKSFLFYDNLDNDKLNLLNKSSKKMLYILVSKSGDTLETLTNINFVKKKLSKKNTIIICENNKSKLTKFATKSKILHIKHRSYLGGRYSVLSEVGMLPSYLMGLNVEKIRKNLLLYLKAKKSLLVKNVNVLSKIFSSTKYRSVILLNYDIKIESFLFWLQQLLGESLGKHKKGLLPLISLAPKDHHSLLQLYLDGPKDKLFYIFYSNLKNKKINKIISAQKDALKKVFVKKKIPFREIEIKNYNEDTLGELFSYFILETALLGRMMNINPFDQPAVEEVKKVTKNLLFKRK
tara:strand:- start:7764 stop:8906 length:1143 start_codon:yes stop_codon:yes gene_type:complete